MGGQGARPTRFAKQPLRLQSWAQSSPERLAKRAGPAGRTPDSNTGRLQPLGGQCWAGGASREAHVLQAAGLAQCWLLRPHACPRPRKVFTGDKSGTDLIP